MKFFITLGSFIIKECYEVKPTFIIVYRDNH